MDLSPKTLARARLMLWQTSDAMATNATVTELVASAITSASKFDDKKADVFWLMICGFLVFFMQCGFALLEAGTVRAKNTKNILLKNLLDACVGGLIWWSIGYMIAVRPGNKQSTSTICGSLGAGGVPPSMYLCHLSSP